MWASQNLEHIWKENAGLDHGKRSLETVNVRKVMI